MNKDISIKHIKETQKLLDEAPVSAPTWICLYNRKTNEHEVIAFSDATEQKLIDMGYNLKDEGD